MQSHEKGWLRVSVAACAAVLFGLLYVRIQTDAPIHAHQLNQVIADIGMLLIGFSISVAAIVRLLKVGHFGLSYRKELGVVGFACVVLHGIIMLVLPTYTFSALLIPANVVPFLFAVISTLILTAMTLVSFSWIRPHISDVTWKYVLSLGLLAYAFGLAHGFMKSMAHWKDWSFSENLLPPFGLLVMLLAIGMLAIRLLYGMMPKDVS